MHRSRNIDSQLVRPVGFSKVVAELALRNPPPLVPSCLMASMKPIGPRGIVWLTPLMTSWMLDRAGESLHRPLADEDDPGDEGDGDQDVEKGAGDVDPEVPHRRGVLAGETPDEHQGHGDAHRGGHELLDGEGTHLREVRHGRLAAVVLPVGVGHERRGRVEAERLRHRPQVLGIERERPLDADDHVGEDDRDRREDDHGARIAGPALLLFRRGAEQPVDRPFGPPEEVDPAVEDSGHVGTEVPPGQTQGDDQGDDGPGEAHLRTSRA